MDIQRLQPQLVLFRLTFADRPFWLFVALLLGLLVISVVARRLRRGHHPGDGPGDGTMRVPAPVGARPVAAHTRRLALLAAAIGALALYVGLMAWYAAHESYYDFAEPTMAAVAWLFERGRPIYHALDAAERYSHMYGPLAFIIPGWFLAIAGPGIASSKAVGIAAALIGLGVIWRLVRAGAGVSRRDALLLTALFAVICLMYRNMSYWIRPDSFLLLFTSIGLLAATSRRPWLAAVGTGVCAGLLVNLKITGLLYALPALALLVARFGAGTLIAAAAAGELVVMLPFVAFGNVSIANYLLWMRMSAKHGLLFWMLGQNIEWALFLLLPLAPTLLLAPPPALGVHGRRWLYGALALGLTGVAAAASKPGAGTYHLMPFWPIVVYALALHLEDLRAALGRDALFRTGRAAFMTAILLIAATQQIYFLAYTKRVDGIEGIRDVTRLIEAHPGASIAMGYAQEGERLTFLRPLLVFASGEYPIDAPAVQEYQLSGIVLPEATFGAIRRCAIDLWLFPQGARPFEGPNRYPMTGHMPLFPERFRQTFLDHYTHSSDTRYFQVWRCRAGAARP